MSIVQENPSKSRFRKFFQSLDEWFEYKNKDEWLKDMKGSINKQNLVHTSD
jgi:hypothetical protein